MVAAGDFHNIALDNYGTAWTWGANYNGQLGGGIVGMVEQVLPAVHVAGLDNLVSVTAGAAHTVALKADGAVWTWGRNDIGQLGDGSLTEKHTPVQVHGPGGSGYLANIVKISACNHSTLALSSDGTVWAWGYNGDGQLGDGSTLDSTTPAQVAGLTNVTFIHADRNHSAAVKDDGSAWAWGRNNQWQLGDGTTTNRLTPVQIAGPGGVGYLTNIIAIGSRIALKNDGTVWTWGMNLDGELGDNTTVEKSTPVQALGKNGVGYLTGVIAISGQCQALKADGSVWGWGYNLDGRIGDNTTTSRRTPVQVAGYLGSGYLTNITQISAGTHALALSTNGTIWAWGSNGWGMLGDGTLQQRHSPVRVTILGF
jgi:alpha-tubulin suppressor-like RCC1 family protein